MEKRYQFEEENAKKETGKRIRELRKEAGLTVKSLSDTLGINRKTLEGYEQGEAIPPVRVALEICNQFDCEMDYLFGFQDHKVKETGEISEYTGLDDRTVEALHSNYQKNVEFLNSVFYHDIEEHTKAERDFDTFTKEGKGELTDYYLEDAFSFDYRVDDFVQFIVRNPGTIQRVSNAIQNEQRLNRVLAIIRKNKKLHEVVNEAFEEIDQRFRIVEEITENPMSDIGIRARDLFFRLVCDKAGIFEGSNTFRDNSLFPLTDTTERETAGSEWIERELGIVSVYSEDVFQALYLDRTRKQREYAISMLFLETVKSYWEGVEG